MDGDFLTDTAEELFKKKEVLKVPVMMGITNHEFGWILPQVGGAGPGVLQLDQAGFMVDVLAEFCTSRLGRGHDQRVGAGSGGHVQPHGGERRRSCCLSE